MSVEEEMGREGGTGFSVVCVEPEFCEWRSRLCLRKKICWGSGERNEGTCVVYRWGVEGETGLWIFVYVDRRVYVSM